MVMVLDMNEKFKDLIRISEEACVWFNKREREWSIIMKRYPSFGISYSEGRIYLYKNEDDFPDRPDAWYGGEYVGSWDSLKKRFVWAHDNPTSQGPSFSISKKAASYIKSLVKTSDFKPEEIIDQKGNLMKYCVAIAAMISNARTIILSITTYEDVKEDFKMNGVTVPPSMLGKTFTRNAFAVIGDEHKVE